MQKGTEKIPATVVKEAERAEIQVSEADARDLVLLDRSDFLFAALYGVLFIWGLYFTLMSI